MSKTVDNRLGMLLCTCDADHRHFDRVLGEFTRLQLPFAVSFDHCSSETKRHFMSSPLYLGGKENDATGTLDDEFDESHRQGGLDVLMRMGFEWAGYLDTDEAFAPRATRKQVIELLKKYHEMDLIDTPLLDLWGDDQHYRDDGPFYNSHRERFYHLRGEKWKYTTAVVHAPKLIQDEACVQRRRDRGMTQPLDTLVVRRADCPLWFLHYGIMDYKDCQFHIDRWNHTYTRKVGKNPYAFYDYISPANAGKYPPRVKKVADVLGY